MEMQITFRLPNSLAKRLDSAAKRLRCRRSELVRLALEHYLNGEIDQRPIEHVRDLLGRIESGIPDLGQRHREYLMRRLRHGR